MKLKVRKKFICAGRHFNGDPYLDDYINMECPSCREIIHYGYEICPKCGAEIDQNDPEVQEARKRAIQDRIVGILLMLAGPIIIVYLLFFVF